MIGFGQHLHVPVKSSPVPVGQIASETLLTSIVKLTPGCVFILPFSSPNSEFVRLSDLPLLKCMVSVWNLYTNTRNMCCG